MYVPLVSPLSRHLYARNGGGGGGGGASSGGKSSGSGSGGKSSGSSSRGKSSGGKSSSSSSKSSSSSSSPPRAVTVPGATNSRTTATAYGSGGARAIVIPSGQLFAGRTSGGGTRGEVYGTPVYGSGYPGISGRGVFNRGFPFIFWPVVWGLGLGYGAPYLYDPEYGIPSNTSRPGGPMSQAMFTATSSNSTFFVIADNSTVASLITSIHANCTLGPSSSTAPTPFNATTSQPLPEQVVQYYRASTVALALAGYNNTSALGSDADAAAVPLPGWVDHTLLDCLNYTIGEAVPLISGADGLSHAHAPHLGLLALVWVLWFCFV